MFGSKQKIDNKSFTSLIAKGVKIVGDVEFSGTLKVQGEVSGSIKSNGEPQAELILGVLSGVRGDEIVSHRAIIDGELHVKVLRAEEYLEIGPNASLLNVKILYRSIKIHDGAFIHQCQLVNLDHTSEGEII